MREHEVGENRPVETDGGVVDVAAQVLLKSAVSEAGREEFVLAEQDEKYGCGHAYDGNGLGEVRRRSNRSACVSSIQFQKKDLCASPEWSFCSRSHCCILALTHTPGLLVQRGDIATEGRQTGRGGGRRNSREVLNSRTRILESVRELVSLAHTDATANEADRRLIIAIESETDALPIGEVRKLWAPR